MQVHIISISYDLVTSLVKPLIWRKKMLIFRKDGDSVFEWEIQSQFSMHCTETFFREINSLVTSFINTLRSRNFCRKNERVNFRFSTLCDVKIHQNVNL